jgi:hypothetical protein
MDWLYEIEEFKSVSELDRFREYISDRVKEGELSEITPEEHYFGRNHFSKDRWFRKADTDEVWRLVHPDFPFKGFFKKVKYPLDKAYDPD